MTNFLKNEGGTIAYEDYGGEGAAILLAPGIGDLRAEYRLLAPRLKAAGLRPVLMDLRGHGESSIGWQEYTPEAVGRDLLGLAHHLGSGPVWLAGCSMATASALWAAVESPGRVRGIIGLGPSLETARITAFQASALAVGMHGPWKVRFWTSFYGMLYPADKPADFDEYCTHLRKNLAEPGRYDALRAFMQASKQACVARAPQLDRPALIVMGARDPDFADPSAKALAYAELLHGKAIIIPNSGHYPHVDAAETSAQAIVEWIAAQA